MMKKEPLIIRQLSLQPYAKTLQMMQTFTQQRTPETADEIWILEHEPVFTLGQRTNLEHLLAPGNIPVIQADRGGQVTYHGPGQLVAYVLLNLKRNHLNVRKLVTLLEETMIAMLNHFGFTAIAKAEAPGVYVNDAKIGSVGLRIRRGYSYHGLSFNVKMDLSPFARINPCGFKSLKITQLAALTTIDDMSSIVPHFCAIITNKLNFQSYELIQEEVIPWQQPIQTIS